MLLSDIIWQQMNKTAFQSQVLYKGEAMNLLIRELRTTDSGVPVVPASYKYILYDEGTTISWVGTDPTAILKDLWPHKMTPLEYKCWQLEQKR